MLGQDQQKRVAVFYYVGASLLRQYSRIGNYYDSRILCLKQRIICVKEMNQIIIWLKNMSHMHNLAEYDCRKYLGIADPLVEAPRKCLLYFALSRLPKMLSVCCLKPGWNLSTKH